jgi:hypothetical protein
MPKERAFFAKVIEWPEEVVPCIALRLSRSR